VPLGELAPDNADHSVSARMGDLVSFTSPFDITGQPAISLPLHWNDDNLPIGVQFVGAYGREDVLIRLGAQLETAAPWHDRHPTLP
jgi:amidase